MRLREVRFAGAILLATAMTACSAGETRVVIVGEDASNMRALQALEQEYEEQSGVQLEFRPFSFEDAFNRVNQDLANGTGLYDIIMQYNFSLSSFVRNDYVFLVEDLVQGIDPGVLAFEQDLYPNAWAEVGFYYRVPGVIDGEIAKVGYPFAANTMLLAYNRELFDDPEQRAGFRDRFQRELVPPTNWQQYREIAEYFTQTENSLYGVCLQGASGGWLYYEWANFLFGMGGTVMKKSRGWEGAEETEVLADSPESVAATEFYVGLKPFNVGVFSTVGAYEQLRIMKEGNVAMVIMWSDLVPDLLETDQGGYDTRFGFAPIPGPVSGLAGGAFFINKDTDVRQEALDYILWVMQEDTQVALLKRGLISPLRTAYQDPEVQSIPYIDALRRSLERGVYMFEAGPDAELINQTLTTYLQRIWDGQISVPEGLRHAKAEIETQRQRFFVNQR
jgi:multiple sugar transport system substrate-binding protein